MSRARVRKRARRPFLLPALLLAAIDLAATHGYAAWTAHTMSSVQPGAADAIAVLYNGVHEPGRLNAETQRRINHANALYRDGVAEWIVCVGGAALSEGEIVGATLMREALIEAGVPGQHVLTAPPSFDSTTNLEALAALAAQENWRSVAVISSPHHLLRVRHELGDDSRDVKTAFNPYDPNTAQPRLTLPELWVQVHYEWLAWSLTTILSRTQLQTVAATLRYYF